MTNSTTPQTNSSNQPPTISSPSILWNCPIPRSAPVPTGQLRPRKSATARRASLCGCSLWAEGVVVGRPVGYRASMSIGTFNEIFDRPIDPVDRLLRRRIVLLSGPIDHTVAQDVMAPSMASVVLAVGSKGQRRATPNARILIHQPWSGQFQQTAADLDRTAQEILRQRDRLDEILARATGQPVEKIHADTDRDTWLSAEEARDYGLIDEVAGR